MNAEHEHLASAYVDGELTDDERRIAEADPAVMAEVAELRALRRDVGAVEPPSDTARESAISAAMVVFHEQYGDTTTPAAAPVSPVARRNAVVVPFWRRPAAVQWLGAAAAVLFIGVLGVVVVNGLRTGDGDDDSASDVAVEELADKPASEPAADDAPRLTESVEAAPTDEAAEEMVTPLTVAGALADDDAAEDAASEMAAEAPAADGSAIDGARFFAFENTDEPWVITVPDELQAAAAYLVEVEANRPRLLAPTPETSCGPALARAVVDVDGEKYDVYLVVELATDRVIAYDADCDILLTAELAP